MRAAVVTRYGGPEVIAVQDVADPVPASDEILVRVVSSAINRADTMQREGGYPDPRGRSGPEILGLEFAGTVAEIGAGVTSWKVGDAVMGIEAGACNADLVTTHARQALPVPSNVALDDAGAIPEVYLTAWDALVVQGGLTSGRWALVHAGASGVGTAAIQLAKAIGARIAVTCSAGKADACRELGADLVLERSPSDWVAALKEVLPDGVDVVLDVVGGDEANRNLAAVRPQGTIMQVGLMGGGQTPVNLGLLLVKRLHWIGTALRTRPLEQKVALSQRFRREVIPLFESGVLKPVIDSRFALDDIVEAHRRMDSNANVGKIVLRV